MTTYTFVPKSAAEVLASKIAVWESRLAYAQESDKKFVPECERALTDLRAKLAKASCVKCESGNVEVLSDSTYCRDCGTRAP